MGDLITQYKSIIEGLIFAADEPLTPNQLKELVEGEENKGGVTSNSKLTSSVIASIVEILNEEYNQTNKPYQILQLAGGYIFATNTDVSTYVGRLRKEQARRRLTQAALETLAIIAYKQPITKSDVETIRGVHSDYILRSLMEKDLITVVGRGQSVGRPLLYGTTRRFLQHFGLNSLSDLPKPREIEELIGETEREVEKRLLQIEKERMEREDEVEQRQRSIKPHPISEKAVAKIIPLKSDYRPRRREESQEKEITETPPEPVENIEDEVTKGFNEEPADISDEERKPDQPTEQESKAEGATSNTEEFKSTTPEESMKQEGEITEKEIEEDTVDETPIDEGAITESEENQFPDVKEYIPIAVEPPVEEHIDERKETIRDEQEVEEKESAWQRWKNKIATFIKKIFG